MKFKTYYSRFTEKNDIIPTCSGDRKRTVKTLVVENNIPVLKKDYDVDIHDEINSYSESCDMSLILNKILNHEIKTDFSEDDCLDLSEIPLDLEQINEKAKEFREMFDALEDSTKNMFNNNIGDFVNNIDKATTASNADNDDNADPTPPDDNVKE